MLKLCRHILQKSEQNFLCYQIYILQVCYIKTLVMRILGVSQDWVNEFMSIPVEYRVNPFDVSSSGDLFFADKRNLEYVDNAKKGKTKTVSREEAAKLLSFE